MKKDILKILRDPSHDDFIVRWAMFVKEHPSEWKKIHTEFIDAQYEKAYGFIERLRKTPNGEEKIRKLYGKGRQS